MAFLRPLLRTLGVQYILTARGGQDSNVPDPFTGPGNCSSHSTLNSSFLGMCSNPVHDQFSVWRTMQISGSTFQHHSLLPGKFWASQGSWITASFSSPHWYCCALSGPPVLTPICRTCVCTEIQGVYGSHCIYFPSRRDHSFGIPIEKKV